MKQIAQLSKDELITRLATALKTVLLHATVEEDQMWSVDFLIHEKAYADWEELVFIAETDPVPVWKPAKIGDL